MGLLSWRWLKKEAATPNRRESAPPMSAINYDPNANREEYLQAFGEFKQRGSLYNQLTIREESEETGSQDTNNNNNKETANKAPNQNVIENANTKSGKTKRRSLPNKMSRSILNGSAHKKTNTPNNASLVNENNNSIFINEIREFEGNCINDASFGATAQSPPQTFYRNNSNPFSPEHVKSESSSARKAQKKKLEESRQRACGLKSKLKSYIRSNTKTANSSHSSGAYRPYDLDSISSGDGERVEAKKSNGQDIPNDVYNEIVNIFGDVVPKNNSNDLRDKNSSPAKATIEHGISGISPLSAYTSFRRCEGVVDDNFGFLDETKWKNYLMDDSEPFGTSDQPHVKVTDLDNSNASLDEQHAESRGISEALSDMDSVDQWNQNIDSTMSPQANKKHPIHIIECKPKDIKPKLSALRNTIVTPFDFSSGSFRKTTVTLKKCSHRDSASTRLVEEAIERDYEILSKVKHPNIVILMAACFHRKLINHMTLVLEPVDYTLNYYLHQMDKSFNVIDTISIVQQIASAALYLQECGYIHSNISSHNVLLRERPWSVKLSSFELATDVDTDAIRTEVEANYAQFAAATDGSSRLQQSFEPEEDDTHLRAQYKELSKRPPAAKRPPNGELDYMHIPSKYLIYDKIYRQRLSMHNVMAPELLAMHQRFVFPTTKTDVYSLCLLLWEILNQCVPFVVYNRLDMERMMAAEKLNLPIFERERCYFFRDVFRTGLAVDPDDREMDVTQLIERLEDIELELLTGGGEVPDESSVTDYDEGESVEHVHHYENFPLRAQTELLDVTVNSSVSDEPVRVNGNNVSLLNDLVLSPSSLDFDKSLKECERTSTKKLRKKPPRKFINNQLRELFPVVTENVVTEGEASKDREASSNFVDLNESFREISEDVRRHVFDDIGLDEKLNENLAVIADDIRRKMNDTRDVLATVYQPENVLSKIDEPSMGQQNRRTTPAVVGFSIKRKNLNESKTHGNVLDSMPTTSGAAKKLFNFTSNDNGFEYNAMPNTPIARQNYLRRSAWLSNQQPNFRNNDNGTEELTNGKHNEAMIPMDDNKKVNVSVRIVHNKITPKKKKKTTETATTAATTENEPKNVDEGRPSILSKIKFFNSANETSETDNPLASGKHSMASFKVDEVTTNNNKSRSYSDKKVNERSVAGAAVEYDNNFERSGTMTNERQTIINELTDVMTKLQKSPNDQPQRKQLFENKLWKRELDICNRSLNSNDGGNQSSKVVAPKFRSVRDTILKFEKRSEITRSPSSSDGSPTELMKSLPKPNNSRKPSDSPTLIKRTIYSERIISGVDLSPLDSQQRPMFDKFNFGNQKVATRVSLRQVRQTSSDVGVTSRRHASGKPDVRHTICGSEMELLSFNASTPGPSTTSPVTKYVCFNCASRMSSDELKALTYDAINTSMSSEVNALEESPIRRCQARVKIQDTRSIEDLYIDDDFVHGLGANMELQSDSSDLLDFDLISTGLFNSNCDAAEHNNGN